MDYYIYGNELYHYGRKGMKWGQRIFGKDKLTLGGMRNKTGGRYPWGKGAEKKPPSSKPKKKSLSEMSNSELEEYVVRMEKRRSLERRYNDLQPKQKARGRKIATDLIKSTGNLVVNKIAKPAIEDIGRQAAKSLLAKNVNEVLKFSDDLKVYPNNKKVNKK